MLFKTKGIVLHTINYSENSKIIKTYTDNFGLQSYIVKVVRNKKSQTKAGFFQPLSILDMVVYQSKNQGLHHVKELTTSIQFENIPYDIKRSAVTFFIAELLYKSLHEDLPNKNLFDFIFNTIEIIDKSHESISDFHLIFMIELSKYLGFYPRNNFDKQHPIFNLMEGCFQEYLPEHPYFADKILSEHLNELLNISFENFYSFHFKPEIKKELVLKMIDYYRIHIQGFNTMNSNVVLEEVFHE